MRMGDATMWRRCLLFSITASLASAQGALSGPSLGIFLDPAIQGLRNLRGIPGSAVGGENIELGYPVAKAAFSSAQDYALAASNDGTISLVRFGSTGVTSQVVSSLPKSLELMAMSPKGQAAVFAEGSSLQILAGLPAAWHRANPIDTSTLPGVPSALAISDDGAVVLVSVPDNTETSAKGGVFVLARGSRSFHFVSGQVASDLAFFPGSHDALLTNATDNSVTAVRDVNGAATFAWIFTDDRLIAPSVARVLDDGQRILVASSSTGVVAVLDRDGRNPVFLPCNCAPNQIAPLRGSVYQLTDSSGGLIWIVDLTDEPHLWFVPVPPPGDLQ